MEAWWGKLSFEGMPAFRDQEDGMYWVWDPESKTYTKKQKADQPDRGHQTGGDNNLFDPFVHTEWSGVPELEGHMAGWNDNLLYGTWYPSGDKWYLCEHHSKMLGGQVEDPKDTQRGECEWCKGMGDEQQKMAQEFVPEGQVKCPNCQETTDMPQCPTCMKDLTPEWNKEQEKIDFLSQPGHTDANEFWSDPLREPKRNRMKTDDSFPSMISKTAMKVNVNWDMGSEGDEWSPEEVPPTEVEVPWDVWQIEHEEEGTVADWLSDQYGWLVNNWQAMETDPNEMDSDQTNVALDAMTNAMYPDSTPGDTVFPENWALEQRSVRDYLAAQAPTGGHVEDLEMKGLNQHELAAIKRLITEVTQGTVHPATSYWDLTPRELAQEYGYIPFDKEGAWEKEVPDYDQERIPTDWNPQSHGKSFDEMEAMLEQYGKGRRPGQNRRGVGRNSWLERRDDGSIALKLHNTDVVNWNPDRITLDTGGWHSRTTRDRMNSWIPGQISTKQKQQFYHAPVHDPYNPGRYDWDNPQDYYDQMALDYEGNILPHEGEKKVNPHYYSHFILAQKLATQKLSEEEWDQWFSEGGPAKTEIGKWLQDKSGQLFYDQGLDTFHEDIARKNNVAWKDGVAAVGSIYNDNTADIQVTFPGAAIDQNAIQAQLQSVFGTISLSGPVSAEGSEQKGTVFEPVVISSGQFVLQDMPQPVTGQAWVKERSNGIPFSPEMILVAEHLMTDDYELWANGVKAIITATGGLTSHAASLAISEHLPVIVGIGQDYNKIETGNYLKIDPARQDITVLPYLTGDSSTLERQQTWDNILQNQRQREENLPTFAHYDEERAWRLANDPKLDSCPECDAPMAERNGEKFCPDCGHKQPIITVQAAEKTAFWPAAVALLGRLGLSGGAAAAGEGAAGGAAAGAAPGGIGSLMRGAMSPKNMMANQGVRSLMPGQEQGAATAPQEDPAPNAWMQGTIAATKTAIPLENPDEIPEEVPLPKPLTIPSPAEEEEFKRREKEREREREKEREPQKVPASVRKADTFGEEEDGWATKNRGENSDPEHDGSGASFEEKGDSPELLKDVNDAGGTKNDDAEEAGALQGGDPKKALDLFDTNLPLILEFATSEQDGSSHPILRALDEILEAAFPGYKDLIEEIEELTGQDIDHDSEEGEEVNAPDELDNSEDDEFEKAAAWGGTNELGLAIGADGSVVGQFVGYEDNGMARILTRNGYEQMDPRSIRIEKAASTESSLWHYGWETSPTATPAPTMPVPGQAGTCQLCGQSHMPGTPCPTNPGSPVMQQPGVAGQVPGQMPNMPQQNLTPPQTQKVITKAVESSDDADPECPTCKMDGKACDFHRQHSEVDDNTRQVQADASHMDHQHKHHEDKDTGDFEETLDDPDVKADMTDVDDSETSFVDEDGDPLIEGQDYELLSSEYAIPDKITVDSIDRDSMVFTIHSGDVDYRDELSKDDIETFGYKFTAPTSDGIDSVSDFALEDEDPIRPGHDALPQVDDLTEPATVVSSLDDYTGSFRGDSPDNRDWLMEGSGVDVDPALMAKLAGKDYSPREQREFIDETGTARNLDKLDLEGTHYVLDDDLGTGDTLW